MNHLENKIEERYGDRKHFGGNGRVWTGLFILIIGVAALLKSFLLPIPDWMFSWQMLLIILGFFIGVRHNFRGGAWFILILIGGIFLLNDFFPDMVKKRYIWPIALILLGMFMIFKPQRRAWHWREHKEAETTDYTPLHLDEQSYADDEILDSTSVFGGIKKKVFSKDFKGGDIVNIMGGTEINLSAADINGRVALEVTQIFGGTKIIVPPHWDVKPEMAAIFGGIDDKRKIQNVAIDPDKVLILKGTSVFGGIEVQSF